MADADEEFEHEQGTVVEANGDIHWKAA